ncbi:V-type ATP synthase subunit I [Candidatus Woesearchaeota archaeon]|nr:V-type ATP synthase subunit I [Candidatus Woesearchaeota archaeon]
MLRPYEMSSVIITGQNSVQESTIKELHSLKILHIVEHSKNELADIGKPLESASRLSEILVRVRALVAALNIKREENKFELKKGLLEIEPTAKKLSYEVNTNLEELKRAEELISKNEAARHELEILKDIDVPLEAFTPYKTLAYFTGYVKDGNGLSFIKKELPKTTDKFMLFESIVRKKNFVVLFVYAKFKEQSGSILQKAGFVPITFTNIVNLRGNASYNLEKTVEEARKLRQKKQGIKKQLEKLGNDYKGFLVAADEFLSEQLEKAEAPLKFAATQSSFLIKGWVPSGELSASIERLNKISKNKIFVHFEPAKKEDKVPVKLKNPKYAKAFEFFIDLYSMPIYKEIDPTFFIFLTFPIFFGIMLGDIGYGLVSLIAFWIFKRKMPKAKSFFNILILASFVSILFGFLYGEFFGEEKILELELPHLLSRVREMFTLLYITIAIGIIHVNTGLILGFINEFRSHGLVHAVYAKASWIILEIGIALLVLSHLGKISVSPLIGAIFLGMSILMLLKGEGIKGLIELPSILTNVMSYARLMAIGLSSVILAVIVNEQSREFFQKGGFFVLIGALILVVGHIVNLMLGLLGSFLHSLRLHYVEFFSKFFHGGAKKYQPFGAKE